MAQRLLAYVFLLGVGAVSLVPLPTQGAAPTGNELIQVRLGRGLVQGRPLWWSKTRIDLMSRDGQLVSFRPTAAKDLRKIGPRFYSYTPSEMRARLQAEFGRDFEVAMTPHYLVVSPRGMKNNWAQRFEELFRAFTHYFRVRGLKMREAEFPLVAIVFKSKQEMQKYAASTGMRIPGNYAGYYAPASNRVCLYDDGKATNQNWGQTFETVIHEATHQTAFNTGVHTRFSGTPRWLTEGLATAFEARGVYNSSSYPYKTDRINRGRLADFKQHVKTRPAGFLEALVTSDRLFDRNPAEAYAECWALTFYLCETQPRRYAEYLTRTAARKPFEVYSPQTRVDDFKAIFGNNLKLIEAQFLRYMERVE